MTEHEWLASASPVAMLHHLNADGNARKPLLYAAALLASRPALLTPALKLWERAIESVLTGRRATKALDCIQTATEYESQHLFGPFPPSARAHYAAIADAVFWAWQHADTDYEFGIYHSPVLPEKLEPVRRANADLVRDIFGNPFRPVSFAPEWRTDTATAIARQMYDSRDFSAMPVLADALQDAGCDNEDVLAHCRDPQQVHVRGCWVADLVLGYE
ncbi:hypothetical protein R5W23_002936 [Gemmata sp. JC673]|uniref:SMI1/KNR4 family protein n=1 Tax=Gemmata algarum TaxID=2975278 RepID=A0ABU5F256_9BACT|nr:hypothetical protein [Gemmata algarum]MDY3561655.1 hypothetical protein [Gemmata algarum]